VADVVIRAEGLGKSYSLRHQRSGERYVALRDVLADKARNLGRRLLGRASAASADGDEEFWALSDVSFEVRQGEVLGIIGRNGAGKSTLLKILSRITEPTKGRVRIRGRVASLLEVGTGFHPELTGRENIFLNGAILGMSQAEIRRKFDEIVAFAEIEKFLDTPVKRYSSGMYVRIAFAVAAHLDPEILVVDEVLAVGDAEFRRRCLGKMRAVSSSEGRTVLFVSHDMSAIQGLCRRSLLLLDGRIAVDGLSSDCVATYLGESSAGGDQCARPAQSTGAPTIVRARIDSFTDQDVVNVECCISSKVSKAVSLDLRLADQSGYTVGFGSLGTFDPANMIQLDPGESLVCLQFPSGQLAVGSYFVSLDLTVPDVEHLDRAESCLRFEITRAPTGGQRRVLQQSWGYGSYELPVNRRPSRGGVGKDAGS
jgi:homopolymeric O-antigen transport system ATP-binding protein